jgi:Protein of unknown function (DUF1091)
LTSPQVAYIQFDNVSLTNIDEKLINVTFWIKNSDDKTFGFVGFECVHLAEYKKIQERFQIFRGDDNNDYTHLIVSYVTDTCKFLAGVQNNFLMRIINEDFFKSINVKNFTCPTKKNLHLISNTKYTDNLFPPIIDEVKFKVIKEPFAIVSGQKKWTRLYTMTLTGRIKK